MGRDVIGLLEVLLESFGPGVALALAGSLIGGSLVPRGLPAVGPLRMLAGIGAIGVLLAALGALRLFYPVAIVAAVLAMVAISLMLAGGRVGSHRDTGPHLPLAALLVFAAALLPVTVLALFPPGHSDDTTYHLPLARLLADHHAFVYASNILYSFFPQSGETVFAGAIPKSCG